MSKEITGRTDYLSNCRPLCVWQRSEHPKALAAAKKVFTYIRDSESTASNGRGVGSPRGAGAKQGKKPLLPNNRGGGLKVFDNHLKRVLWDLAISRFDPTGDLLPQNHIPWIAIELSDQAARRNSSRYNRCHWKPAHLRKVVDLLEGLSLIERSPFKHVRQEGYSEGESFTTRILGTPKLWALLDDIRPNMITRDLDEELVVLVERDPKTKKKQRAEYSDTDHPDLWPIKCDLSEINQYLSKISVTLSLDDSQKAAINQKRTEKQKQPVDWSMLI